MVALAVDDVSRVQGLEVLARSAQAGAVAATA
jgi:hypothetical protein